MRGKRDVGLSGVVVFGLLAGCLTGAPPIDEAVGVDGAGAEAARFPWFLEECRFVVAAVPVDRAALERRIPDDFQLAADRLGIEVFRCTAGAGLVGNVSDMIYGSYFASVTPPGHLSVEGVDEYYYKWWVLVPDDDRRARFAALGLAVDTGQGGIDLLPTERGPLVSASMDLEGRGAHTFRSVAPLQEDGDGEPGWFAELSPRDGGGHATWHAAYTSSWGGGGAGIVEVPAGGFAAGIMGATTAAATLGVGVWSFHDGTVAFPAAAGGR